MMSITRTCPIPCSCSAVRARPHAYFPTPMTMLEPRSFTISQSAASHERLRAERSATCSLSGVMFFPTSERNMSGHILQTKQQRKKFSGRPHSSWKRFQNRFPLTCREGNRFNETLYLCSLEQCRTRNIVRGAQSLGVFIDFGHIFIHFRAFIAENEQ